MSDPPEPQVGRRIRALREQRGLSLRALSARCGLSSNAISLIERGENSPTVSSLHLLAEALEVSIASLFEAEREQAVLFTRPEERLRSEVEGIVMEGLGLGLPRQRLEPFLVEIVPGGGNAAQPITHTGEEFVFCLSGVVDYTVAEAVYRLLPGRSLLFKADQPHCFQNVGEEPARLIMIFSAENNPHLARRIHLDAHRLAAD